MIGCARIGMIERMILVTIVVLLAQQAGATPSHVCAITRKIHFCIPSNVVADSHAMRYGRPRLWRASSLTVGHRLNEMYRDTASGMI
jgi:hypothetical protein